MGKIAHAFGIVDRHAAEQEKRKHQFRHDCLHSRDMPNAEMIALAREAWINEPRKIT